MADDFAPVTRTDDFEPVKAPAPSVPISLPDGVSQPIAGPVANTTFSRGKLARLADAFGTGWTEGIGPEPFGMSKESETWLAQKGVLFDKDKGGPPSVLSAMGEAFLRPAVGALDMAVRGMSGTLRSVGDALLELGVPRDIVAMPGAFQGSPGGLGRVEFRPGLPRSVRDGIPLEAELSPAKPLSKEAYDRMTSQALNGEGSVTPFKIVDKDKATAFGKEMDAWDNLSQEAKQRIEDARDVRPEKRAPLTLDEDGSFGGAVADKYVRYTFKDNNGVPGELTLDVSKPDNIKVHWIGEDAGGVEAFMRDTPTDYSQRLSLGASTLKSIRLQLAELYPDAETISGFRVSGAREISAEAKIPLRDKPTITDLDQAADLGTIGPERPTVFEARAEAKDKARTMAADAKSDVVRSDIVDNPAVDKAGNIRLDLIEVSGKAEDVIRAASEANGGYMDARRGDLSLSHQEQLSQALGVPVDKLDVTGMGRRLNNDNMVRTTIQALVQSSEDVALAARQAHLTGDSKDLIDLQKLIMRHDVLQEHTAGLTAEWGRTGNVFQEFRERVKDTRQLGDFLKDKGRGNVEDLRDLARKLSETNDPSAIPKFLADARKPTFFDKLHYYWVNSILSGQFSQATYLISDAMFATYDNLVIKPTAGVVGAIRGGERAYIGEGAAGFYGYISGVPEGIKAAWEVLKTGEAPLLPREITTGSHNPVTEQRPIGGRLGTVVGLPSRELSMIHTLQSNMAYRAQLHSLAYREAVEAGHTPGTAAFKNEMRGKVDFPTEAMMDEAVKYSQRMTFTDPITGAQAATKKFVREVPGLRFIVPFTNVPMNTLNAAIEGTPLSWMNDKMRANLKGENGKVAQDTQIARLAAGSAIMGMTTYWALNGNITGGGPVDPEDRAVWLLTHQPNSIKVGSSWVSYDKFAPIGTLLGLSADLTEVYKSAVVDKELDQAAAHLVVAASNMILSNTGMKGLADVVTAISAKDKPKEIGKWAKNFAASFMPFSSATGQIASMMDPNIRDVQTMLDAVKNKLPGLREDLFPVRDWSGIVRANSRSEWGALFKNQAVNMDPVDRELEALNMKFDKISKHVSVGGGFNVELTAAQHDRLQDVAGVVTRQALNSLVQQDGWYQLPAPVREEAIRNSVNASRKYAVAVTKMNSVGTEDDVVRKGNEQRLEWLNRK